MSRSPKIYYALLPFAWLYGLVLYLRNKLFDWHWLKSRKFPVPVIVIGNLTVGGTGKTPHTEYLIRLLQPHYNLAVLSRGYKRKSKGFRLAGANTTMDEIGDEPFQMARKYPAVRVAVDADRCHGIDCLIQRVQPAPQVFLLDDAYQHRYVKPGLAILLTDYNRLFTRDCLLPAGRLRESALGKGRAAIVIVSKCPENLTFAQQKCIRKELALSAQQQLYFTTLKYGKLRSLFADNVECDLDSLQTDKHVLLVTGIASPVRLIDDLKHYTPNIHPVTFPDHHNFTERDMQQMALAFQQLPEGERILITTEKDAARLIAHPQLPEKLKPYIYVLPVEVQFLNGQQTLFNQKIIEYVRENSRNSSLS